MSRTKRELIADALGELALSGSAFDIEAEEFDRALSRMNQMVAAWERLGIRIGYQFPAGLDDASGLADTDELAVTLNLAVSLAPGYGKQLDVGTRNNAANAYKALLIDAARPAQQKQQNVVPIGQGNAPWRGTRDAFFPNPSDSPLSIAQGGQLDIAQE